MTHWYKKQATKPEGIDDHKRWRIGIPPYSESLCEVMLKNGSIRTIKISILYDLFFTDCMHQLQNVLCDKNDVRFWRVKLNNKIK